MKTINELHIDFDLKWNNLSSFKFRALESYEIDWFLNRAYLNYVKTKTDEFRSTTGGIKDSTIRLEELSPILEIAPLVMYKEKKDLYYSFLPANYFNDLSENLTYYSCVKNQTFTEQPVNYQFSLVKFNDAKWGSSNLTFRIFGNFINPDLSTSNISLFTLSQHTSTPVTIDYRFYLINLILQEVNRTVGHLVNVYWERFNDIYIPNTFIFITLEKTSKLSSIKFEYDLTVSGSETITAGESTITKSVPVSNNLTLRNSDCRLVDNEIYDRLNKNPFSRTSKVSPLAYLKGDKIYIQSNESFVPSNLQLTYYRKPNMLNYVMGKNPELGVRDSLDHVSDKLVSEACEYALVYMERNVNNLKITNRDND
jgi:hypothetical protein